MDSGFNGRIYNGELLKNLNADWSGKARRRIWLLGNYFKWAFLLVYTVWPRNDASPVTADLKLPDLLPQICGQTTEFKVYVYTSIGIYQNIHFINSNIFELCVKLFLLHIDVNYWHVSECHYYETWKMPLALCVSKTAS
jgi:hypothetical protein